MFRNSLGLAIRRAGLTDVVYRATMLVDILRNLRPNQSFDRHHPGVSMPPAELLFETATSSSHAMYWEGGRERAAFIARMIQEHLPAGPVRVCEWGCGPARVIRHLPTAALPRSLTAVGTDYNPKSINWCMKNVPPPVTFCVNGLQPPLPFQDSSFDFLYSFSVFTHLSPQLQQRWLAENLRVVRPGGLVIFSVHGDSYQVRLTEPELQEYRRTGLVVRTDINEGGPWYTTYQSPEQIKRDLVGGLEVVYSEMLTDTNRPLQDIWCVRKPPSAT